MSTADIQIVPYRKVWFMAFPVNRFRINWMKIIWLTVHIILRLEPAPTNRLFIFISTSANSSQELEKKTTRLKEHFNASHNKNIKSAKNMDSFDYRPIHQVKINTTLIWSMTWKEMNRVVNWKKHLKYFDESIKWTQGFFWSGNMKKWKNQGKSVTF